MIKCLEMGLWNFVSFGNIFSGFEFLFGFSWKPKTYVFVTTFREKAIEKNGLYMCVIQTNKGPFINYVMHIGEVLVKCDKPYTFKIKFIGVLFT